MGVVNTHLNGVVQTQEYQAVGGSDQAGNEKTEGMSRVLSNVPPSTIPLIDRISDRRPLLGRMEPIKFPSISDVPIIREPAGCGPLMERISRSPPPSRLPPSEQWRTQGRGLDSAGEGARRERVSYAWSAEQWRKYDKGKGVTLEGVRRNERGELDIGDLYTYAFIMRSLPGHPKKHAPSNQETLTPRLEPHRSEIHTNCSGVGT